MANYGKYYVAVRLLLLKRYLEANAGRNRTVSRKELEDLLRDNETPIYLTDLSGNLSGSRRFV